MTCICACLARRLDAWVENQRERLEARRCACLRRLWASLVKSATKAGLRCQQLCFESGLCLCCTCLFQPLHCVWSLLERRYLDGARHVGMFALQCLQFWMPLSVTALVIWLLYRPDRFHPRVDGAALAHLDLIAINNNNAGHGNGGSSSRMIRYDLAVDLSFRNSYSLLSIQYIDMGATAFYNATKLGPADNSFPTSFHQGPKNTTVLHPAFRGVVAVDSGVAAELKRERAAGTLHVRVTVDLTLRYKAWFGNELFFYKYDCWLWFPQPKKGNPAVFHGDGAPCWRV